MQSTWDASGSAAIRLKTRSDCDRVRSTDTAPDVLNTVTDLYPVSWAAGGDPPAQDDTTTTKPTAAVRGKPFTKSDSHDRPAPSAPQIAGPNLSARHIAIGCGDYPN